MINKFKKIFKRIWHGKSEEAAGFHKLIYKGKKVLPRDYVPRHEVWFCDDKGKIIRKVNIKTRKHVKYED